MTQQQMVEIVKALPMDASVLVSHRFHEMAKIVDWALEDKFPPRCGVPTQHPVLEVRHQS